MERIKSWHLPTVIFWLVVGYFMAGFLDGLPQFAGHYMPQHMWEMTLGTTLIIAGVIYYLQEKTGTVFAKIKWDYVWAAVLGFLLLLIYSIAVNVLLPHSLSNNQAGLDKELKALSGLNVVLFNLMLVIIGPAIEETFFRGWMMWAMDSWNKWLRFTIIVFLFACFHHPTRLIDWLAYGGMGAAFTLVRMWTGKVQYSFMTHALWNGLGALGSLAR
ncbi:type II CAAX endopeptidase family protein [Leuconostocaceae bacterium ESL0723]|nr:type II CAAX endopeptidase family protein [Leuconostocaceae bacterium ESL0723]